jgi:hypothetical protein
MFPNRKKFKFQITPTDRQLWAIGVVATTWTLLDNHLQLSAETIAGHGNAECEQYQATRSFKIRLDLLKALMEARVKLPHKDNFLKLIIEIKDAQLQRDRIIHGAWGEKEYGSGSEAFNWMKPHPKFQWKLDFGSIKKVAVLIDDLAFRWQMEVISGESGDNILMSDALKRKLN